MNLTAWYNGHNIDITIPDGANVDLFDLPGRRLKELPANHWLNRGPVPDDLDDFLERAQELLVVVNDAFRPTPTARILAALQDALRLRRTRFLISTGLHPAATPAELRQVFGSFWPSIADRVETHNACAAETLVDFQTGDARCRLNHRLRECDAVLTIGSVEPHYFAGFTGGRKIILPGCASFADIEQNHAAAVSVESRPLRRQGNPVWEDIHQRTRVLDHVPRASIQVVCDHHGRIFFAAAGDADLSYDQACTFVTENFAHEVSEPYDLVISVVYPPLDRNLYQLQKSYENVATAVRDGGAILLLSGCPDGVGDDRFLKLAEQIAGDETPPAATGERAMMGIHKVRRTIRLAKRVDLVLCSSLEPGLLRALPIAARSDVHRTITELINKYGKHCRIAVVLDAASQVLYRRAA